MNSQVIVQNVTILAPLDSPNTDGIDPGELSLRLENVHAVYG
jgi:polygalacturonase